MRLLSSDGAAARRCGRWPVARWTPWLPARHPEPQYCHVDSGSSSGVGVLDKAVLVLTCLESGPTSLAGLVARTGLSRPTAHRLAVALEHHRLVVRDSQGR